jgi:hypothetical protein
MGKRFTASNKWQDKWFRGLDVKYKLLWIYLNDTCSNAGIWDLDFEQAKFFTGFDFEHAEVEKVFAGRLIILGDKYFIPKFIEFQYNKLSWDTYPHRPIIKELQKNDLIDENLEITYCENKGNNRAASDLHEKDKDKEPDNEKDLKGGAGGNKKDFIDMLLDLFLQEYKTARNDDFILTDRQKERGSIGKLLNLYKRQNHEKDSTQVLIDFQVLFRQSMTVDDKFLQENMSPSMILNKLNFIKTKLKNNIGNRNNKAVGATTEGIIDAIDKAFNILNNSGGNG